VSRCQGEGVDAESLDTSPRTLFATHYHELTDLEELLPGRIINLHVSVREWGEEIVFLHRILPGRTDRSYGVHVAKLAGLPAPTVARAKEILETLAVQHHGPSSPAPAGEVSRAKRATEGGGRASRDGQLALFTEYVPHPAVNTLREIKLDSLSPMQAFDVLRKLKDMAEDGPKAST
jgi:DNA mismatch repair protein MutS